jgi:hypothetical protein
MVSVVATAEYRRRLCELLSLGLASSSVVVVAELSGWDALWIALAGGAIATILGFVARFLAVPSEIAMNDRTARERDQDLEQWLADEHVRLKRQLERIRNKLAAKGLFYSGSYGVALNLAKEAAIHAYRDQERQARRDVALIRDREHWPHGIWRWLTSQSPAQLKVPDRAGEVLDAWATPPSKHLSSGDVPPRLDDPRNRSLEDVLAEVRSGVADFE